jgi:4-hydroxy-tetrahydrodipicolinate reductase
MNGIKIGLMGYGKMGRAIETVALADGCTIAWKISSSEKELLENADFLRKADVVIEFSRPESAFDNVMRCLRAGVPVVSGTTGWADRLPEAQAFCRETGGAMLWASNFSIGVNLFFALNQHLAQLLAPHPQYRPGITEIHHTQKLDAPSGTAITLAEGILENTTTVARWALQETNAPLPPDALPVVSIREGTVPGTHEVIWQGPHDAITIQHEAQSREGFAAGAVLATRWMAGKKGVFSMTDVLFH